MEQFPDDSPLARLRLPIVILGVFLSFDVIVGTGATVSGTVTHDAPGSSSATTAAPASTNDEDVVAADGSTRPARLAEDVLLLECC
jgi:guanyl-specific ribonuclease Sa